MDDPHMIDIENATVVLSGHTILKDISWQVRPGQHWFVLGENGSGKTTLMNLILAFVWPRAGARVAVLGNRYGQCEIQAVRKRIGWVSAYLRDMTYGTFRATSRAINVVLSGFEASIGLYRDPTDAELAAAQRTLEDLECAHLADHPFAKLSSGEQMKILIGRATVARPEILVLDEPCSHLDMRSREHLLDTIDGLTHRDKHPLILFVTHRVEDIIPLFTHGLIMKDGRVLASGPRNDILNETVLRRAFSIDVKLKPFNGRYWPYM